MKIVYKILILLLFFQSNLIFGQHSRMNPNVIPLKSDTADFKLLFSEMLFPDFNKADFDDSKWKDYYYKNDKKDKKAKTILFRSYIKIDSSLLNEPLQLSINQNGASEIYLDGKKIKTIGKTSNNKVIESIIHNSEPFLISLSDTKTHVLAFRHYPYTKFSYGTVLIISGPSFSVSIEPAKSFIPKRIRESNDFHKYSMLIFGFFLALGFIHFLFYLMYRKAIYNLYFAFYNLSISAISYLILTIYNLQNLELLNKYIFAICISIFVFCLCLSGFINTLFAKKTLRFKVLLVIGLIILATFYYSIPICLQALVFFFLFVLIESFILILRAMIRKQKEAFIVGGGILMFFGYIVLVILDGFFPIIGSQLDKGLISKIVLFSCPFSISAYLGWQFATTNTSLQKQLNEVNRLSEVNLHQEQEKQQILQNQNEILEKQVNERTSELQIEKQKSDDLLLNILPEEIAEELKQNGKTTAKHHAEVSVLFTDFVGFTTTSERIGVEDTLKELNSCFTEFDRIMGEYNLEKIKTIGDAYLAVSGLPIANPFHAKNAVDAALEILNYIEKRKSENPNALGIRIGIHSGAVIAGIVGVKKFAYDIWGDTVNTAARMEQNGEKGKLNVSGSTYDLIHQKYDCEHRGKIETKGKGALDMYFVNKRI